MLAERRRYPRFPVQKQASVVVTGGDISLPYHLIDISEGGMAFCYLNASPLPLTDSQMDIYLDKELHVGRLTITVVGDHKLASDFIPTRHCSVRFGTLTPAQHQQLQAFIRCQTQALQ
ncbi:MAG: PilZ domain-containing protein [Proteobacteria bacterium]|nr:PilZ domain-containing protein [Pseudomonadota bacterium]